MCHSSGTCLATRARKYQLAAVHVRYCPCGHDESQVATECRVAIGQKLTVNIVVNGGLPSPVRSA